MKSMTFRIGIVAVLFTLALVAIAVPRIQAQSSDATPAAPDAAVLAKGEKIVSSVCLACHQAGGKGIEGVYPALAGNALVNLEDPKVMVATILEGRGGMPRFAGSYSDEEIAAIATYVRSAWGNTGGQVTPEFVAQVRAELNVMPTVVATPSN
jgi:mono/diheme cytochrome c family protein